MKKALLVALCFVLVSFALVNGTFALPNLDEVFQAVTELLNGFGMPEEGGTTIDVEIVSDDEVQRLFPGGAVSRVSQVQNLGTGAVYFRLVYAVQYDEESWPHLDIDFTAGNEFTEHNWQDIKVGGTPYKMKVFTYNSELAAKASSPGVRISISMDTAVTSEQLARYRSDFLQIQALAIDPTPFTEKGFTTAKAALDKALPLDELNPF